MSGTGFDKSELEVVGVRKSYIPKNFKLLKAALIFSFHLSTKLKNNRVAFFLKKVKKKLDLYCIFVVYTYMREKEKMTKLKNFNPMALREKYSIGSFNKKNNYSSFWLDSGWDNTSSIFDD